MALQATNSRLIAQIALPALVFVTASILRTWHIARRFWLLGDQIRDWRIALGPFSRLPLVGPATHVHGYAVGPAFYWILWVIRVLFGPWFENLPHAGGIGQAVLQSGADALLLVAIWKRTRSVWIACATIVLLVTASYDLALAPIIWNPVVGSTLAKIAMALVLLDWHRGSAFRVGVMAAVAWLAVHAYTGAIYVTVSVFVALLLDPLLAGDRSRARRNALLVVAAVIALQIPYAAHQLGHRFSDSAMEAVTGSLHRVVTGQAPPEISKSVKGFVDSVAFIQVSPWHLSFVGWVLLAGVGVIAVRCRHDPLLLCMTLLPQALAIVGYSLFLASLDHYFYLSLMPPVVLTMVLAATNVNSVQLSRGIAAALLVGAFALVPARVRFASTLHRMPQYGVIVEASRTMARRGQALRRVETEFPLPPTSDPEFVYRILGGPIDRNSEWVGMIQATGDVSYRRVF